MLPIYNRGVCEICALTKHSTGTRKARRILAGSWDLYQRNCKKMYAVIFKAETNKLDDSYSEMALRMRDLAINEYGCTEFISVTENDTEIAISYWESQEQIREWKQDAEHLVAQELGRSAWYKSYKVQVVEVIREYCKNT